MSSRFPRPVNKKSIFDRQRAEAEAKRKREAAETAAVYEDFVKSFDDGHGDSGRNEYGSTPASGGSGGSGRPPISLGSVPGGSGGRRHFSMPSAGPGGGPGGGGGGGGGAGLSSGFDRPRKPAGGRVSVSSRLAFGGDSSDEDATNEDSRDKVQVNQKNQRGQMGQMGQMGRADADSAGGWTRTDDGRAGGSTLHAPPSMMGRAEEKAASRPTIRLASMPPNMSPAAVRALVAPTGLSIEGVHMQPTAPSSTSTSSSTERKSAVAIVTLAADTAGSDIDAAVSTLQNRYLGYGFYLNLHRHLSSAVVASVASTAAAATTASAGAHPFGARPVPAGHRPEGGVGIGGGGGAPGPGFSASGFAPPAALLHGRRGHASLGGNMGHMGSLAGLAGRTSGILHVPVRPPRDIKKLRMIHKVVESVLSCGPEFEALLMSRPEVQREERWAWLWDARSEAGVWYRYRLWQTMTGYDGARKHGGPASSSQPLRYVPLFEDSHAWKMPEEPLPFEFVTSIDEFVSDSEYGNSSDDSDYEDGGGGGGAGGGGGGGSADEDMFLTPMEKAKLTHFLARLPTTLSKLRKGDIARVTAFAMTHASRGSDEIVDMLVANIERPFSQTRAGGPSHNRGPLAAAATATAAAAAAATTTTSTETTDTSGAKLIALYVVSDILSASATSGIRHAWRYRQLFEVALRNRRVFEGLGLLADQLHWGRLRADKWKRSVGLVLDHWEGWSVFSAETQEHYKTTFASPPSAQEREERRRQKMRQETEAAAKRGGGRWRTVETVGAAETAETTVAEAEAAAQETKDEQDTEKEKREDGDQDNDPDDDPDEFAYRSEYTDDEQMDLACLEEEDIDGEPMSDVDVDVEGTALTAEEVALLLGTDRAEDLSEEGEIGSDEEAYAVSGVSMGESDVDMEDVAAEKEEGEVGEVEVKGKERDAKSEETSARETVQRASFQILASPSTSRKRMRAADMFADAGEDE